MEWMLMPIKRYAEFSGRSRRQEYWMFVLLQAIIGALIGVALLVSLIGMDRQQGPGVGLFAIVTLMVLFNLALLVPTIAVQVRRFHDLGYSGWLWLINLVPLGSLVVLVFMCLEGNPGENLYGPDPKRLG